MASTTRTRTARTKATPAPAPEPEAQAPEAPAENPRTTRSKEKLARACELIRDFLADGEWHSSNEIHAKFGPTGTDEIAEGMFGRAKKELGIVHKREKPADGGRAEYFWKMPAAK